MGFERRSTILLLSIIPTCPACFLALEEMTQNAIEDFRMMSRSSKAAEALLKTS
jgi:hypothetical protein